jgi:hypothetical protein
MRQSLSENRAVLIRRSKLTPDVCAAARAAQAAIALSAVLVGAAVTDQIGIHSLVDHAAAVYAPSGTRADPSLLYGLLHVVAVVGALLWLAVVRAVQSRRRWARGLAVVVVTVTAALAFLLLVATEYGARVYPPLWGVLALLPPAAGIVAVVRLTRRRQAGPLSRSG